MGTLNPLSKLLITEKDKFDLLTDEAKSLEWRDCKEPHEKFRAAIIGDSEFISISKEVLNEQPDLLIAIPFDLQWHSVCEGESYDIWRVLRKTTQN